MNAQQVSAAEALVDKGVPLCDFDPLDSTLDDPIFGAALAVSGGGDGARTKIVRADGSVEEEGEEAESADIGSFDAFPLRDSELGSARSSSVLFPPLLASAAPDGGGHDAGQLEVEFQESGGGGGESYRRYVAAAARGKRCTGSACSLQRAVAFHYRPQCAFLWHQLDRLATGTDDARAARGAGTTVHSTGGVTSVHAWEGRDAAELPAPYGTAGGGGVNATEVVARDMDPGRPQAPMMAEAHLRVMSMSMRMLASRDTTMAVRPPLSPSSPPPFCPAVCPLACALTQCPWACPVQEDEAEIAHLERLLASAQGDTSEPAAHATRHRRRTALLTRSSLANVAHARFNASLHYVWRFFSNITHGHPAHPEVRVACLRGRVRERECVLVCAHRGRAWALLSALLYTATAAPLPGARPPAAPPPVLRHAAGRRVPAGGVRDGGRGSCGQALRGLPRHRTGPGAARDCGDRGHGAPCQATLAALWAQGGAPQRRSVAGGEGDSGQNRARVGEGARSQHCVPV